MKSYSHPSLDDVSLVVVMQALSDPCRLAIVRTLLSAKNGEMACNAVPLQVVKATRSHHFSVLREAGLAFTRMDGTKCMTSIRRQEFDARFPGLLELVLAVDQKRKSAGRKINRRQPALSSRVASRPRQAREVPSFRPKPSRSPLKTR